MYCPVIRQFEYTAKFLGVKDGMLGVEDGMLGVEDGMLGVEDCMLGVECWAFFEPYGHAYMSLSIYIN